MKKFIVRSIMKGNYEIIADSWEILGKENLLLFKVINENGKSRDVACFTSWNTIYESENGKLNDET